MKRTFNSSLTNSSLTLLIALFAFSLPASAQPVVWSTSSLVRTGRNDAAGTGAQAVISAAKGEYESFQIAVQAPPGGLTNVNVSVSDLAGPGGAIIAKSNFSLFREQYVHVSQSSPNWSGANQPLGAGWYPDGLIPFADPSTGIPITGAAIQAVPFNLSALTNQPIWVDLLVPRDAAAGQYTGTYTITSDQGNVTGAITLNVWNFALPMQSSLKSAFLYWTASSLASDAELLRNRISPLHADTAIQSTLVNNYGLSTVGLPYWSGADVSTCAMSPAPSVSDLKASAAVQQPGLTQLIYSADEIDGCPSLIPTLKSWAANMHQAGIKNLVTMAPNPLLFDDGSGTGRSAVDIWTILPVTWDESASAPAALAKGDSIWSYNALVQDSYSPKWLIDFAPINFRVQPGFISNSLGLTGLLYWRLDRWSDDPWNEVNNTGAFSDTGNYPGEGMLVYPGGPVGIDGVAPSMRLKWLRDGVEDYEYLQLLKTAGQSALATQKSSAVGANWSSWTQDSSLLLGVRDELGKQLDQLNVLAASASAPAAPVASACAVASLTANILQPAASATLQSGIPQSIQVQINDSCGGLSALNGSATATFSNGDSAVTLRDLGSGIWSGRWTPVSSIEQLTLTVMGAEGVITVAAQVSVSVTSGPATTNAISVVNAAAGAQATPETIAAGSYVTIYGTNLADGSIPASSTPLPTALNGTQVFLGSKPLPLVYAGPNQINGVIPRDLDPNGTYTVTVVKGLARSAPLPVSVLSAQPAIYTADASGSGQGVVAIAGVGDLAAPSRPAQAGEYLTIYCNGLGAVAGPNGESAPADGTLTPTDMAFHTIGNITVSFAGTDQPVQFAGLAPSMVAIYQVNVQVPALGLSGDAIPLIVKVTDPQTGNTTQSNTVTIALR